MKFRAHRRLIVAHIISAIATQVLLCSCAGSPPIEPLETKSDRQIEMLKAQLGGMLTSIEQSQKENRRQWDVLQSALTEVARRDEETFATISRLRLELLKGHGTGDATLQSSQNLIRELRADFAAENRAHNELVLMITERLNANAELRERLAHLEKDGRMSRSIKCNIAWP